jgi:hypothetical protein
MYIHFGILAVCILLFAILFLRFQLITGNLKITGWVTGVVIHYYVCGWWFLNKINNYTVSFLLAVKYRKLGELFVLNHHVSFNNGLI